MFHIAFSGFHSVPRLVKGSCGLGAETAQRHVTRILINAREDIKYSPRAIILLIGLQIVDIKQLDEYLAKVQTCNTCIHVHVYTYILGA